jgi:hypothetical protein
LEVEPQGVDEAAVDVHRTATGLDVGRSPALSPRENRDSSRSEPYSNPWATEAVGVRVAILGAKHGFKPKGGHAVSTALA